MDTSLDAGTARGAGQPPCSSILGAPLLPAGFAFRHIGYKQGSNGRWRVKLPASAVAAGSSEAQAGGWQQQRQRQQQQQQQQQQQGQGYATADEAALAFDAAVIQSGDRAQKLNFPWLAPAGYFEPEARRKTSLYTYVSRTRGGSATWQSRYFDKRASHQPPATSARTELEAARALNAALVELGWTQTPLVRLPGHYPSLAANPFLPPASLAAAAAQNARPCPALAPGGSSGSSEGTPQQQRRDPATLPAGAAAAAPARGAAAGQQPGHLTNGAAGSAARLGRATLAAGRSALEQQPAAGGAARVAATTRSAGQRPCGSLPAARLLPAGHAFRHIGYQQGSDGRWRVKLPASPGAAAQAPHHQRQQQQQGQQGYATADEAALAFDAAVVQSGDRAQKLNFPWLAPPGYFEPEARRKTSLYTNVCRTAVHTWRSYYYATGGGQVCTAASAASELEAARALNKILVKRGRTTTPLLRLPQHYPSLAANPFLPPAAAAAAAPGPAAAQQGGGGLAAARPAAAAAPKAGVKRSSSSAQLDPRLPQAGAATGEGRARKQLKQDEAAQLGRARAAKDPRLRPAPAADGSSRQGNHQQQRRGPAALPAGAGAAAWAEPAAAAAEVAGGPPAFQATPEQRPAAGQAWRPSPRPAEGLGGGGTRAAASGNGSGAAAGAAASGGPPGPAELDPERLRELSALAAEAAEHLAASRSRAAAAEERTKLAEQQEQAARQHLQAQLQAAQLALELEQQANAMLGEELRDAESRVAVAESSLQGERAARQRLEQQLQGERAARQRLEQQLQAARQAEADREVLAAAVEQCEGLQRMISSLARG
jgi:hypothetical protein